MPVAIEVDWLSRAPLSDCLRLFSVQTRRPHGERYCALVK